MGGGIGSFTLPPTWTLYACYHNLSADLFFFDIYMSLRTISLLENAQTRDLITSNDHIQKPIDGLTNLFPNIDKNAD